MENGKTLGKRGSSEREGEPILGLGKSERKGRIAGRGEEGSSGAL